MAPNLLQLLLIAGVFGLSYGRPTVTDVKPRHIGYMGGTVTIHGTGFSEDVFNQFDPVLGNKVWFANEFVSVSCQTPINWNFMLENPQDPSTTKIVCDLPARDGTKGSNWFNLQLKVDGEEVENNKAIEYYSRYTPELKEVVPRYGKPGDIVTFKGRIFTKEYGNSNFGDSGTVEARREESITALMLGTTPCELADELGNVYALSLNSPTSDDGVVGCKPAGSYIGPMNATLYVSGKHGRSRIKGAYSVNSKGQLFVYHTLPEVSSVSPNTGGSKGGTHVTIRGNSFDAYGDKTQVKIGSTPCTVVTISNNELVCSTPPEDSLSGLGVGARGLLYELWKETEGDVGNTSTLDTGAADYYSKPFDGSYVDGPMFNETNGYTQRLTGLFIAPYTGDISFYLEASDESALYISNSSDPANKEKIIHHRGKSDSAHVGHPHSGKVMFEKGKMYYLEAVHVQKSSSAEDNYLKISLWQHKTVYHNSQTSLALDERQNLRIRYDREFETQRITFQNMENANGSTVTFTHAGKKSKDPVDFTTGDGWNETMTAMLTYSCTYSKDRGFKFKQDYENTDFQLPGSGGRMRQDIQAYCGERALENQERIFHSYSGGIKEIDAKKNPWLCFATKGLSYLGKVSLLFIWKDTRNRWRRDWIGVKNVWTPSEDWSHQCLNMEETARNPNISWIAKDMHDKSYIQVQDIILNKGTKKDDYYIDEVTVAPFEVQIERKAPALHNDNIIVKNVDVQRVVNETAYDIKIVPWTCNTPEDDFELLGIENADIVGLNTDGMSPLDAYNARLEYLRTSANVTFTSSQWMGGSVTIERIIRGTRAYTGNFSLSWEDKTIVLPPYPTPDSIKTVLEGFGMTGVSTWFSGSHPFCYDSIIDIDFAKSLGGDLPEIGFNGTNLDIQNNGLWTQTKMHQWRNGGIKVPAPGGDFFQMIANQPTISVTVDGFLAACSASDCSFTHDSSLTPSLSAITSAVVGGSVELIISGSGFTSNITDFIITVGNLNCEATDSTSTEITCMLEAGAAGTYDVNVVVKSKGVAEQPVSGQLTHTVSLEIFSNSPTAGSLGGGTPITVYGSGFPNTLEAWSNGSVAIDGYPCKITKTSFSEFECLTSAKPSGGRYKRSASDITIVVGSLTISGGSFTYDSSLTPIVSTVSPTSSSPLGGEVLMINGSALGAAWGRVLLGDNECTIISWFPAYITCILPPNTHGIYPVHVEVAGNGFADVSGVSGVSYDFVVTDLTPRKGSTLGGTRMKISGSGFGDCSNIVIQFGDSMKCDVDECSNTEIVCNTKRISKIHKLNNGGRHPVYGPGYVWSDIELEILPEDTVEWVWNLQVASKETGISVHQVESPASNEWDGKGFKSDKSPKGGLRHQFFTPGVYYYSSQPVFGTELFMKGTVKVVSPQEDSTASLSVMMEDIPAAQQVVADTGSVDFDSCVLSAGSECVADPESSDAFLFTAAVCLTPVVNSIAISSLSSNASTMPIAGFNGAELIIEGTGFSDNSCQNVVTLGDNHYCIVSSSSASRVVCNVDGTGETPMPSLKAQNIAVNVRNTGYGLMSVSDPDTAKFYLVPKVTSTNVKNEEPGAAVPTSAPTPAPGGGANSSNVPSNSDFCDMSSGHTMCIYPGPSDDCQAKVTGREFTTAGKTIIVGKHNALRSRVALGIEDGQPPASNMRKLVWNDELAAVSQRWADQCTFGHDAERNKIDGTYVGQNAYISMSSVEIDEETLMTGIGGSVQAWYDEVTDPGWSPSNIKPYTVQAGTGHYTQVVWAETEEIGCGWVSYPDDGWYKSLVICNYAVGGNMISASMYEEGEACSECPDGYSCEDGLCAPTAADPMIEADGDMVPEGGSWAGGYLYVVSGLGLVPFGGSQTVTVTFGDYPYAMSCSIVDVSFDYISCLVPDFSQYKGSDTKKVVPVKINLGYDQLEPVLELDYMTYTFDDTLTPSADSMSPSAVTTSEEISIGGSNFGTSVRIFLRNKNAPTMRKRRSLPEPVVETHDIEKREIHEFWTKFTNAEEPTWRCMHGKQCNHDDVSFMPSSLERKKRELPENWQEIKELEAEDDDEVLNAVCMVDATKCNDMLNNLFSIQNRYKRSEHEYDEYESELSAKDDQELLEAICMTDIDKCNEMLNNMFESGRRVKRSINEAELIEMALLTEGTYEANIVSVTSTDITFLPPALPAGEYDVIVNVDGQGNAVTNIGRLRSNMAIDSISPNTGSICGGQSIKINGSGFCEDSTAVTIGGKHCEVYSVSPDSISCKTPTGDDGSSDLVVNSCGQTVSSSYTFSAAATPEITSLSPASSSGSTTLVLTGTNFGTSPVVSVGKTECFVTTASESTIECNLIGLPGGDYPVIVYNNALGLSCNTTTFTSTLEISSVSPSSGSFGGGTKMVIQGTGFDTTENPMISVCVGLCEITSITTDTVECLTPANNGTGATEVCDVTITQESGTVSSSSAFTYDQSLTPSITMIDPVRGGTGGGTLVTITGTGFADSGNKVMIDGSVCDINTEGSTEISCYTNYHSGAIKAPVIVDVPSQGYAVYSDVEAATFYYIDRWSSIWTWGGLGTPLAGEFIVITEGQTILLDVSTPVLAFLLIKGGTLMFDRENPLIELQSEYILLVEGGALEIGTEEEPYDSKAIITMHGHVRCTEMPIFGCKVLGVRNGTIDFHGEYVPVTWTHLAETAPAGATEITLKQPVTWKVGDHIAIATTSDRSSMKENEEHHIAAISEDGYTITLKKPLKYQHISISQTFGTREVESRGEVGLLTRNILIRGTKNEQFVEVIPACEEEFDSGGAFSDAMQTCFAGKFGEELGHDEFGSVIIISPKYKDQGLVEARIEYVEFENAGQAFRVGRYPIHFHLPGNMNTSYVRGNAVHHSNNRACTLHDVANMVVERNVVYNVKGLSFFLEDGVELNNTLQYNLAMFTRMSNSLLNPDINPASFWIVNAWNRFRHNACAGGTHFCFWLRPAKVPDGPSWTRNYCPNKVPFLEFYNNTAHSMGWYGFWIFGQSNHATYDPHDGTLDRGFCNGKRIQTRIGSFTTWNNKRGFEIVSGANIRLENQTHMDHDFAGYEIFTAKGPYGEDGPGIFNAVLVGHSQISDMTEGKENACTPGGIHVTDSGYTIKDVSFYNFDRQCYGVRVRLEEHGATTNALRAEGLVFENSPNKILLPSGEEQGLWISDIDGSLTGTAGANLVGDSAVNPPSCNPDTTGDLGEAHLGGHTGSVCPDSVKFHRLNMVGENSPSSLKYNPVTVKNDNGNSSRPWGKMAMGWSSLLLEDTVNWVTFDSSEHVTNISYSASVGSMYDDDQNDYVLIGHKFYQQPDRFTVLPGQPGTNASEALTEYPTYENSASGEWYYNNETATNITEMVYIISDKGKGGSSGWRRKKRAVAAEEGISPSGGMRSIDFKVYRCFYANCLPPPPPTLPPGRPLDFKKWSDANAWLDIGYNIPEAGDEVFIPPGIWFVMDIDPPPLKRIYLYGGLEIEDNADHKLDVEIILIQGGRFQCGLPDAPFQNTFELILRGDHFTEDQPLPNGPNLGAKALGVFGFADMHGKSVGKTWTKLASTAPAGSNQLELVDAVAWTAGSEIVISTTSYELLETERRTIASVSGNTVTLTEALEFDHLGTEATLSDGSKFPMRAEVGILTRNVRIVGNDYKDIDEQQFGARVLVGEFMQDDITYTGFARFENVEFATAGQEGWFDNFDPRYALAYLDTGDSTNAGGKAGAKESYVKKCAFNYNYNSAIGVFGSNNIPIEDNVIFNFINNGIFDEGERNKISGNLVTKGLSISRIKGQSKNPEFFACINIKRATETVLMNNVMAGCAQGGLYTIGNPIDIPYAMSNNEAHGTQHGIHMSSAGVSRVSAGTVVMRDFYTWMNYDYGIQTESENSLELSNIVAIDNGAGFLPFMFNPSADSHKFEEKYFSLTDSIIVSVSDIYDCSKEMAPDVYKSSMEKGRRWRGRDSWIDGSRKVHHTGIIWPIFQSKFLKPGLAWHKPVVGAAGSNPALRGLLNLNNVTFANFKENCGKEDVVFRTNFGVDDVNWPINATDIKFLDTVGKNKIYMDIPTLGKINPSDCTDFDCDGFKKAMIWDQDGSVAEDGNTGTIIPDSAYEWEGIPVRGLGYYRVPKPMVTELNGDKIEYADKMPNTGIYRDGTCVWNEDWRAYKCQNINHRLMIIESMDRDSKIRRLSPIAMLGNAGSNGYIDLVNGPQDFSCCSGYICAERLSTFFTMVATGIEYEVMFTSIPPQNFRIHMLHNEGGDAVRTKIWFPKQQRLDVYVNGMLMNPNNMDFSSESYNLLPPEDSYIPGLSEPNGANYFDPNTGHLYLIVKGPDIISIKTQPIVVLKIGMTVPIENFFEENVVGNLAGLLGIDPSNIRVTNIVREGSVGRKREAGETITGIEFEIGPPPSDTLVDFIPEEYTNPPSEGELTENPAYTTTATPENSTTAWVPPANHLDFDALEAVSATIANKFQTGGLGDELGLNVTGLALEQPITPPKAPPPYTSPEERGKITETTFAEQQLAENLQMLEELAVKTLAVPSGIKIAVEPENVLEMQVIKTKPSVYVTDADGKMISELGDDSDPWKCTATLKSGDGSLGGNTTVPFINGVAEFDEMFITKMGSDYILEFEVTYPAGTGLSSVEGIPFNVGPRPLGLKFDEDPALRKENTTFDLSATIWDEALDKAATKTVLKTYSWNCFIYLSAGEGNLTGMTNTTVAPGKNKVKFSDLVLTDAGLNYDLQADCFSLEPVLTISAKSSPFHVHDYPVTGLLRKTVTDFKFTGPFSQVEKIIKAYNNGLIGMATCEGCPDGSLPKGKGKGKSFEGKEELEGGIPIQKSASGTVQLENWNPCEYPIFFGKDGSCTA